MTSNQMEMEGINQGDSGAVQQLKKLLEQEDIQETDYPPFLLNQR